MAKGEMPVLPFMVVVLAYREIRPSLRSKSSTALRRSCAVALSAQLVTRACLLLFLKLVLCVNGALIDFIDSPLVCVQGLLLLLH